MPEHATSKQIGYITLGLLFMVLALYRQAFGFDFSLFDDHLILLNQAHLFGPGPLNDRLAAIFLEALPREEPLIVRDLAWLIDSRLFGFGNASGYHFSNVLVHAATTIALFVFLYQLSGKSVPAAGTAVVFACLAVNVEPVAWIMGRKDLLAGLFLFLMLIAEMQFQRASRRPGTVFWYLAGLFFLVLACLSKISAVVLPMVLLLLKWTLARQGLAKSGQISPLMTGWRRPLLQVLPHMAAAALLYGWYARVVADYGVLDRAVQFSAVEKLKVLMLVDPLVLARYFGLIVVPNSLSVQYTWAGINEPLGGLHWLGAILVVLTTLGMAIFLILKRPLSAFFVLSFLVLMAPYLSWVHFDWWYANRYLYSAAPFLVAPILLQAWPMNRGIAGYAVAVAVVLVTVVNLMTLHRYLPVWANGETLWKYEVSLSQATLRTHNNLASMYVSRILRSPPGEHPRLLQDAEQAINTTLSRFAGQAKSQSVRIDGRLDGLDLTYYVQGLIRIMGNEDLARQLESFQNAYRINPEHLGVVRNLADLYLKFAIAESDEDERLHLARLALAHYRKLFSADSGAITREKQDLLQRFQQDFPALPISELRRSLGIGAER